MRIPKSRNTRSETDAGASHMRSLPRAVFGNGITSRMDDSPARIITRRSSPSAIPPCGGAPYSNASSKNPKRCLASSSDIPSAEKHLGLHVAAVNTNGSRSQLGAVQHDVVRFRAAARRIAGQLVEIFVMDGCKRMMRRVPAVLFLVPFEHREIDHPERFEIHGVQQLVAVVVLLPGEKAELPASLVERLFGALALGRSRPSSDYQQIVIGRARRCASLLHQLRIQLLQIVVNAQPALGSVLLQLVAFLPAERARLRNVNRDRRKRQTQVATIQPSNTWNGGRRRSGLSLP